MSVVLELATPLDEPQLVALVRAYHQFEGIDDGQMDIAAAIRPLLATADHGRIWLIKQRGQVVGYVAICFGYSIEFGGRDAFVDEFFLIAEARGRGLGRRVLAALPTLLREWGVQALHLEVGRDNAPAQRLYRAVGFVPRPDYLLMSLTVIAPVGDDG